MKTNRLVSQLSIVLSLVITAGQAFAAATQCDLSVACGTGASGSGTDTLRIETAATGTAMDETCSTSGSCSGGGPCVGGTITGSAYIDVDPQALCPGNRTVAVCSYFVDCVTAAVTCYRCNIYPNQAPGTVIHEVNPNCTHTHTMAFFAKANDITTAYSQPNGTVNCACPTNPPTGTPCDASSQTCTTDCNPTTEAADSTINQSACCL